MNDYAIDKLALADYSKCNNIWDMSANLQTDFFGFTTVLFDGADEDGEYFKLMKTL